MLFGTMSGYGSRPERDIEVDATPQLRVRPSIHQLQDKYNKGNKQPLEDLWRAWQAINELPANDPHSFFALGGYHGEHRARYHRRARTAVPLRSPITAARMVKTCGSEVQGVELNLVCCVVRLEVAAQDSVEGSLGDQPGESHDDRGVASHVVAAARVRRRDCVGRRRRRRHHARGSGANIFGDGAEEYLRYPLDPNAEPDASEFSWGAGLEPASVRGKPPSEGGTYRGTSPPCSKVTEVSRSPRYA
jgi:hypothetical protein